MGIQAGGDAGDWITYALGIPAAEAELGSDKEYRDFFVPKSVRGARKIIDENMNWVQHTYEKLGNQISIEPIGY